MNLEEIVRRLSSGEDVAQLAAVAATAELAPGRRALLRRCALPHFFDRQLVDEVLARGLAAGEGEPFFDWVVAQEEVEPVPGSPLLHRIKQSHRARLLEVWFPRPSTGSSAPPTLDPELEGLTRDLADHCSKRHWQAELLYHLLAVDRAAARSLFADLYKTADASFDIASCQHLIGMLAERLPFLTPDLQELRIDRRQYLESRCYWADAFYQTSRLYEREFMEPEFAALRDDDQPWLLQIEATGGMGKTMFLRWLIARRCVPEPARIPCARIDFDFQLQGAVRNEPWQFLLELARQLNRQIPGGPFGEFINEYGEHDDIARNPAQAAHLPSSTPLAGTLSEQATRGAPERFAAALRDTVHGPVVLVFDTLEDALLRHQTDFTGLVQCIAAAREKFRGIRLILSGRFQLGQRLKDFSAEFGECSRTLEIKPFEDDEARAYLVERRGVKDDGVVQAMVERAGGMPFRLSLLADISQMKGGLSAAQIRAYKRVDVLYLIERVVRRIDMPEVRWLLRYGVVPRRLTREFVRDVMVPYLARAMAGKRTADDPRQDEEPREKSKPVFATDILSSPEQRIHVEKLWRTLVEYAGRFSWVSRDEREPNALAFHGDILNPMRRLLQPRRVFRLLHRAAFRYYDRRAKAASQAGDDEWVKAVREAIFHRFQAGDKGAPSYWRRAFERATEIGDPRWRHALGVEVLGPEYLEDGKPLRRKGGEPLVPAEILFEANFGRLCAALELAQSVPPGDAEPWSKEAEQGWEAIARLRHGAHRARFSPAKLGLARALLLARRGDLDRSLAMLRRTGAGPTDKREAIAIGLATGDVLAETGQPEAADQYAAALSLIEHHARAPHKTVPVRQKLAGEHAAFGRWDRAFDMITAAIEDARRPSWQAAAPLCLQRMGLHVRAGEPSRALRFLKQFQRGIRQPAPPALAASLCCAQARAYMGLHDPRAALEACDAARAGLAKQALRDETAGRELRAAGAEVRETRALALARLLQLDEALIELEEARGGWRSLGDIEGSSRCLAHTIEINLRAGCYRPAARLFEEAQRVTLPVRSETWVALQLLHAELHARLGRFAEAREILDRQLNDKSVLRPPPVAARIALAGLTAGGGLDPEPYLKRLRTELQKISPSSARLVLLASLRHAPALDSVPQGLAESLEVLAIPGGIAPGPPSREDSLPLDLAAAELQRVLGCPDDSREIVRALERRLVRRGGGYLLYETYDLEERLEEPPASKRAEQHPRAAVKSLLAQHRSFTLLSASILLQEARSCLSRGDRERAQVYAEEARGLIESKVKTTTQEKVRLYLLLADLAAGGPRSKPRLQFLRSALAVADEQGDERTVARLEGLLGARGSAGEAEGAGDAVEICFQDAAVAAVEIRLPGRPAARRPLQPTRALAKKMVEDLEDGRKGQVVPSRLFKSFSASWARTSRQLTSLLFDQASVARLLKPGRDEPRLDIRMEIGPPLLDAVPWELLWMTPAQQSVPLSLWPGVRCLYRSFPRREAVSAHVRWVQAALNALGRANLQTDGIAGRATAAAVRSFQRQMGLDRDGWPGPATTAMIGERLRRERGDGPPRVLIVQPSLGRQEVTQRGLGFYRGWSQLPEVYTAAGFAASNLDDPSPERLYEALKERSFDVLHLCASLRESPSIGGSVLDFSSGEILSPAGLSSSLGAQPSILRAVLVLDVPAARGFTECLRQLFLRNSFAAALFRQLGTPAIVATGLGHPEAEARLPEVLATSFAAGLSLDKVVEQVRRSFADRHRRPVTERSRIGESLVLGTALFAYDPKLVSVAPASS